MNTTATLYRRITGRGLGAAVACAAIAGGAAALALALPHDFSGQPLDPSPVCTATSCQPGTQPLLPGRHEHDIRPDTSPRVENAPFILRRSAPGRSSL